MLLLNLIRAIYRNVHRIFTRGGTRMTLPPPPSCPGGGGEITPAPPTYVHTNAGNAAV